MFNIGFHIPSFIHLSSTNTNYYIAQSADLDLHCVDKAYTGDALPCMTEWTSPDLLSEICRGTLPPKKIVQKKKQSKEEKRKADKRRKIRAAATKMAKGTKSSSDFDNNNNHQEDEDDGL